MRASDFPAATGEGAVLNFGNALYTAAVFGRLPQRESFPEDFDIDRDREFLSAWYGVDPGRIFFVRQVHGARVVEIHSRDTGTDNRSIFCEADGLLTVEPEILLCIRTADCLPVFFHHTSNEMGTLKSPDCTEQKRTDMVGVIHAGWRSLAAGIIGEALELVEKLQGPGGEFRWLFGPAIGGDVYEVGPEVAELFEKKRALPGDKYLLDLKANAALAVQETSQGSRPPEENGPLQACTFRDNRFFYSHRRGDRGRNLNVIMLNGNSRGCDPGQL